LGLLQLPSALWLFWHSGYLVIFLLFCSLRIAKLEDEVEKLKESYELQQQQRKKKKLKH
jgi:hypothetical protein